MTSKEALKLAILEYEKDLENDENNQWVKNVLKGLKECQKDLERLEKLEKDLKIIIKKRLNFNRFNYAIKYWKTTKEQVDVYNSGIGKCYKLTEEEFELVKEVLECQKD